jgi:hypothetical protein
LGDTNFMKRMPNQFVWQQFPEAEKYILSLFNEYVAKFPQVKLLQTVLKEETSTRLFDWVDHLLVSGDSKFPKKLKSMGFKQLRFPVEKGRQIFGHPGTIFPRIIFSASRKKARSKITTAVLGIDNIPVFLNAFSVSADIEGSPLSPYRRARVWQKGKRELLVVERRAYQGFIPRVMPRNYADHYLQNYQKWFTRPRYFIDPKKGIKKTIKLAKKLVAETGVHTAAWLAFAAEREYWLIKNRAGQIQKRRQDRYGLGWANHDHHTFRNSRQAFNGLLQILKIFGFQFREKFYAGKQAGWGAQVLEQPVCGLVVFADVDLSPEELKLNFLKRSLSPRQQKGTVGLWCALHGESIFDAGLHHLAARFLFREVDRDLRQEKELMLPAFSRFPYLHQAFTQGEKWNVDPPRIKRLYKASIIKSHQSKVFIKEGAIGSHLENIQRDQGFKGFNQESVSDIIRRTDPRINFGAA